MKCVKVEVRVVLVQYVEVPSEEESAVTLARTDLDVPCSVGRWSVEEVDSRQVVDCVEYESTEQVRERLNCVEAGVGRCCQEKWYEGVE